MPTPFATLEPLEPHMDACVHCGFCLPACPSYLLLGQEMDSPRGRIYSMRAGLEGRTALTRTVVGHFDTCLGCMACETACPSGVHYAPLIALTLLLSFLWAAWSRRAPRPAGLLVGVWCAFVAIGFSLQSAPPDRCASTRAQVMRALMHIGGTIKWTPPGEPVVIENRPFATTSMPVVFP